MFKIEKATREQAKLRLITVGASGSGKTHGALIIANALGKKIIVIDTENGRANLFAKRFGFEFDIIRLRPPYDPEKFIAVIDEVEKKGYDVIIFDSLSHEWDGEGGYNDLKTKLNDPYGAKIAPRHRKMVERIIRSEMHAIVTLRAKTEYSAGINEKGKLILTKIGTTPAQKNDFEFEFHIVFNLNQNHYAYCSKDDTDLFDGQEFLIDEELGRKLAEWLKDGVLPLPTIPEEIPLPTPSDVKMYKDAMDMASTLEELQSVYKKAYRATNNKKNKEELVAFYQKKKEALTVQVKDTEAKAEILEHLLDTIALANDLIELDAIYENACLKVVKNDLDVVKNAYKIRHTVLENSMINRVEEEKQKITGENYEK